MTRGRKPKTSATKPYVKCSLELEPEHIDMLDEIKNQLGVESRSKALRAILDSGIDFEFEVDEEEGVNAPTDCPAL